MHLKYLQYQPCCQWFLCHLLYCLQNKMCIRDRNGNIHISDVQEKDNEVVHLADKEIPVGTEVHGVIDWNRRFDLMQQHSGEHIVSGFIHAKYGYNNVGFHMGSDVITVDLDGELNIEQLAEIETKVKDVYKRQFLYHSIADSLLLLFLYISAIHQ